MSRYTICPVCQVELSLKEAEPSPDEDWAVVLAHRSVCGVPAQVVPISRIPSPRSRSRRAVPE